MTREAMKLVVVTPPEAVESEAVTLNDMLASGLDILHLRKPEYSLMEMEAVVRAIAPAYRSRVMLHSHHDLVQRLGLRGAHLPAATRRELQRPPAASSSTSCHSIAELEAVEEGYEYFFISPVFDSVSKPGYRSGIDRAALARCIDRSDRKIVALGGVTPQTISLLPGNCWGAAVLGHIWQHSGESARMKAFEGLQAAISSL